MDSLTLNELKVVKNDLCVLVNNSEERCKVFSMRAISANASERTEAIRHLEIEGVMQRALRKSIQKVTLEILMKTV